MPNNAVSISQKINKNVIDAKQLDFIIKEIASRMLERLDYIKILPNHILDIGSGLGIDKDGLSKYYPKAHIYSLDISINMLKRYIVKKYFGFRKSNKTIVCADAQRLPLNSQTIDLAWSNLVLPYVTDIKAYFSEINRVLKIGGSFLVSGLGVDSLLQLRELGLATYNFPDMHLIGDAMVEVGFTNPVTDLEYITLEYENLDQLLKDIRIIGCGSVLNNRISKLEYTELNESFNKLTQNGKFPLTLEIFYAHAWKDQVRHDLVSGRSIIQFKPK